MKASSFSSELDFGVAPFEGYFPYTGSCDHEDVALEVYQEKMLWLLSVQNISFS